jgi:transmembrane sensor
VTPEIAAEAALWVARLHGPDRSPELEREFQAWQGRSAAHREAFGKCTEVWQDVPKVKLADAYGTVASSRTSQPAAAPRGSTFRWAVVAGLAVVLVGGATVFQQWRGHGIYDTAVGEQRLVVLEDGTRMTLNTASKVRVDFSAAQRTVEVDGGEALFEVTKDPRRPFVVRAAGSEIVAVGTSFSVRFTEGMASNEALSVTLIEGRVDVRPAAELKSGAWASSRAVALQPGDRLQLNHSGRAAPLQVVPKVDRPNVEQVMAWKRREAIFQDASLSAAVEEMNRYNRTLVVLSGNLSAENLRISGVFRTGDSAGFARAVAAVHGLHVHEGDGRLELSNVR